VNELAMKQRGITLHHPISVRARLTIRLAKNSALKNASDVTFLIGTAV